MHRLRRGTTVLAAVPAMLLACQSAPPAPPPVSETETSSASEPPPFSDLASDIERQMEAERAAALERGAALRERSQLEPEGELDEAMRARRLVEQELGEERLRKSEASLGGLSVTGCVRSEEQIRSLGRGARDLADKDPCPDQRLEEIEGEILGRVRDPED